MTNKFKTDNSRPLTYGEWLSYMAARGLGIALLSGLVSASTDPLFVQERNRGVIDESLSNASWQILHTIATGALASKLAPAAALG